MATFTIELRTIIEEMEIDIFQVDNRQPYPIFDEAYRQHLNQQIVDAYWYREIAFETIEQFINRLNQRLRLIMPYYNQLYKSTLLEFDPLISVQMITETTGNTHDTATDNTEASSTSNASTSNNAKSRSVSSDFPQTMLSPDGDYATSAADTGSESTASTDGSDSASTATERAATGESSGRSVTAGFQTPVSQLVLQYRQTLLNVDELLIGELGDLFFGLWNIGEEYGDYGSNTFTTGFYPFRLGGYT